jgi:uridine kinase
MAPHPLRVAVDGPPAAGKTTLADELALLLRSQGREVIRASTESFHLPRAQRYRHGELPEANYHDSFDYDTLRRVMRDPLGPEGDRRPMGPEHLRVRSVRADTGSRRIRDLARLGSTAEVERRFRTHYIPAQKLYFASARPADHADIIVHNDEPRRPAWEVRPH